MLGQNAIHGTAAERDEWRTASEMFRRSVHDAEDGYHTATREGLGRHLPGARRRKERAAQRFRHVLAEVEERHAPVSAAVSPSQKKRPAGSRRNSSVAGRLRKPKEGNASGCGSRAARSHALASRAIWGGVLVGEDGTTALVHRRDARLTQPLPTASRRSSDPLNAYALASELEKRGQGEGVDSVRWEKLARKRVANECSTPTPEDPVQFGQWWAEVTSHRWRSPSDLSPPSSSASGPNHGHSHLGSDYGGIGGDFGSGHSRGGFSCGFGGGY
jgi:hypothetical protein